MLAVCNEIDQWPPPVPGQTLNLPVMGVVMQVMKSKLEPGPLYHAWTSGREKTLMLPL